MFSVAENRTMLFCGQSTEFNIHGPIQSVTELCQWGPLNVNWKTYPSQ